MKNFKLYLTSLVNNLIKHLCILLLRIELQNILNPRMTELFIKMELYCDFPYRKTTRRLLTKEIEFSITNRILDKKARFYESRIKSGKYWC